MSLLPCNTKRPNPTEEELIDQKTRRDIALSNVYNLYKTVTPCIEDYENPSYSISGACNVFSSDLSGFTTTCSGITYSHNLSEVDDIDLTFNLFGSNQYTGYTGEFCYRLITRLEPPVNFTSKCTPYSGITGSTIVSTLSLTDIPRLDNEFILRTWNVFESQCVSGLTINTSNYEYEDNSKDFYMVGFTNPPSPELTTTAGEISNLTFINEVIQPTVTGSNSFIMSKSPIGGTVITTVNGVFMSPDDYNIDITTSPGVTYLTFGTGFTFDTNDTVQVAYNVGDGDLFTQQQAGASINLEMLSVTGITTGVTASTVNLVNENLTNNRYELFTQTDISSFSSPIVTLNGVNLTYNIDIFKSNLVANKIIFKEGLDITVGDIITIYYKSNVNNNLGDLGRLLDTTPIVGWSVPENVLRGLSTVSGSTGLFTVEVAEKGDTSYSTIITSGTTNYSNTITDYELQLGPITTSSIDDYIYRVRFTKNYKTSIVNDIYTTESFSDNGSFTLDWDYINNTNF